MRHIKIVFITGLLSLTALWMLADSFAHPPFTYFSFRSVFIQYSGVIGIAVMSISMLLATRPKWLERPLNGLDKMYRLHKWLGITGLVLSALHWWWAQGTKWMVGWGWLIRPEKKAQDLEALPQLQQWLLDQRGLAESIGEWAFYLAMLLIILALLKSFPYHLFLKTHKLLAIVYLLLAYHSAVLIKYDYWSQPIGWLMMLLLIVGTLSSLIVLTGQVGRNRKVQGEITSLTSYPGVRVIASTIKLSPGWSGHRPGQFAFVSSKKSEGAHPYTIASAWNEQESCVTFVVKELGDWTGQLNQWLKVGMPVSVEGPYGCFNFKDDRPRQIWIGAGIGVTPFIAKMQHLIKDRGNREVDFFHVTADYDQDAIDKLKETAKKANIRLHITITPKDGRLTPERIRTLVPEWQSASFWF
ncbi:ferric reductase-like transmembrane domain-containing protein [Shewanella sp. Isolate13]|uniref:ferredoxin reductase family protein n=1 Tax=Shewanella sp. Isolate13 TaxID=2908531 RepID=UPI001EFD4B01|nr:ferric reductase-like transmembrane domain-containing protein [Shewanella sp. Isolate13]MCG9730823.1 ferric reductase-like transmembrane domain-containing protein [Shewanella sp. Isolate13]